jgi:hypothetical protein
MAPLTLQVVSDIHLEKRDLRFEDILTPSADILALVGDIGSPFTPSLAPFISWCSQKFLYVLYVPGNHEYYNTQGIDVGTINQTLHNMCTQHTNVIFMYNKVHIIDNYAFIGSILWSHVPDVHLHDIQRMMNDYNYIYKTPTQKITVHDTNVEYQKNKSFLEHSVAHARASGLTPVVLTHHTPSMQGTSAPHLTGGVSCYAFSSTLTCPPGIIRLWACGHTHYNFHHNLEGYELISNQFGYGDMGVKGYKATLAITL